MSKERLLIQPAKHSAFRFYPQQTAFTQGIRMKSEPACIHASFDVCVPVSQGFHFVLDFLMFCLFDTSDGPRSNTFCCLKQRSKSSSGYFHSHFCDEDDDEDDDDDDDVDGDGDDDDDDDGYDDDDDDDGCDDDDDGYDDDGDDDDGDGDDGDDDEDDDEDEPMSSLSMIIYNRHCISGCLLLAGMAFAVATWLVHSQAKWDSQCETGR